MLITKERTYTWPMVTSVGAMLVGVVEASNEEWRTMENPVDSLVLSVVTFSSHPRRHLDPRPVVYPRECHVILNYICTADLFFNVDHNDEHRRTYPSCHASAVKAY